jgi:hypothetical protein
MNKPPLGIQPRHFWLRMRIVECTESLKRLEVMEDWFAFKKLAKTYAEEILYAVTEWEKYYEEKKE